MDPESLKERIKLMYDSIDSYEDSGTYLSDRMLSSGGWFKTVYLKSPLQLRFEWSPDAGDNNKLVFIVKGENGQLLSRLYSDDLLALESLAWIPKSAHLKLERVRHYNDIICGVRGFTHCFSDFTVSPLLSGKAYWISQKHSLLTDAFLNGEDCFVLREIYKPNLIWVSKSDYTIRRCELAGSPLFNEFFSSVLTIGATLARSISPRTFTQEMRNEFEKALAPDIWTIENIRYNHLSRETFPNFDFRET